MGLSLFIGRFEVLLSSLLSSQQVMNVAAEIAHCCISPNRYGILFASGVYLKSLHAFVILGKCVFLMSLYDWQEVRKCSSVSSWFYVPWKHSLSSLWGQVCLWPSRWPGCVRWFCIWSRISSVLGRSRWSSILPWCGLCWGTKSTPIYSGFWWTLSNVPKLDRLRGHFSGCNSVGRSLVEECVAVAFLKVVLTF